MHQKLLLQTFIILFLIPVMGFSQPQKKTQEKILDLSDRHAHHFEKDHLQQDENQRIMERYRNSQKNGSLSAMESVQLKKPICSLLAAEFSAKSYVEPPKNFKGLTSQRSSDDCSNIIINYNFPSDFSAERQAQFRNAFEFAVAIWESQVSSAVPIRIDANFRPLGQGVLGSAGPNFIRRFGEGFPWYGEALLDQILGVDLSGPDVADIITNFNTDFGWYLGTDGQAPPSTFDLVTVVLHELGHGLGFFGSAFSFPTAGIYGFLNSPFIYDTFVEDGSGEPITNFPTDAFLPGLASYLQSNDLFVNTSSEGLQPIYAPSTFRPGSSYSHWDEASFPAGDPNSLMTPFVAPQEANHDPGANTLAMFVDHGWTLAEDCDGPESEDLSERCDITGLSPDPLFPNPVCDLPGVFSAEGGVFGPVGSHVMCIRVDGIDPFNQPLNADDYEVKIGGKRVDIVFLGYDFFEGEQYFYLCVGGVPSTGLEDRPIKVKLTNGCTFTQGEYYDAPDCGTSLEDSEVSQRGLENEEVLTVFPNPSNGIINLSLNSDEAGKVLIQNSVGKAVFERSVSGATNLTLNLNDQAPGIYFTSFYTSDKVLTKKFILR